MWYANTILVQMLATEIGTNKIPYTAADQPNEKAAKIVSHFTGGINGHEKGKPDHEISKNSIPRDNSYRLRAVRKQTKRRQKKTFDFANQGLFLFVYKFVVNSVCLSGYSTQKRFRTSLC